MYLKSIWDLRCTCVPIRNLPTCTSATDEIDHAGLHSGQLLHKISVLSHGFIRCTHRIVYCFKYILKFIFLKLNKTIVLIKKSVLLIDESNVIPSLKHNQT